LAREVTKELESVGAEVYVESDNKIGIYVNGGLV
jgi:hypothetical protein